MSRTTTQQAEQRAAQTAKRRRKARHRRYVGLLARSGEGPLPIQRVMARSMFHPDKVQRSKAGRLLAALTLDRAKRRTMRRRGIRS